MTRPSAVRPRLARLALGLGFVGSLALGAGAGGCELPNPDHCFNRAADGDAWCVQTFGDERPYCSPCAAEQHGCVAQAPSPETCPGYAPSEAPSTETGGSETSGTDTGGSETDTGGSETETGGSETG